jgi:transcriptional regulator with XRE-family HTH domain
MNAIAINSEVAAIRVSSRLTRKEFERLTGIPAHRLEKIERNECGVSLETLQRLAATTAEGKRLAARLFQLDYDTQAELHALLVKATKLAGGGI